MTHARPRVAVRRGGSSAGEFVVGAILLYGLSCVISYVLVNAALAFSQEHQAWQQGLHGLHVHFAANATAWGPTLLVAVPVAMVLRVISAPRER